SGQMRQLLEHSEQVVALAQARSQDKEAPLAVESALSRYAVAFDESAVLQRAHGYNTQKPSGSDLLHESAAPGAVVIGRALSLFLSSVALFENTRDSR